MKSRGQFRLCWSDAGWAAGRRIKGNLFPSPLVFAFVAHSNKAACWGAADIPSSASATSTSCRVVAMSSMLPLTSRAELAPSARHLSTTCDVTRRIRPCKLGAALTETRLSPPNLTAGFLGASESLGLPLKFIPLVNAWPEAVWLLISAVCAGIVCVG